ncbi:hypothetical protein [Emticicia agri]|uniref:Uncharacterized protein n=1 Tax=Emticicia agri TaxID=2492393 RepID=A0A4Q5LVP7_9BACT|nr:hypothetical protein [Emticicia agri]RYU93587.1 hypothetical protein EWM59_21305 [Emticicia agri]
MKIALSEKRASNAILLSYLICALCTICAYFTFEGRFFVVSLQISILVFVCTCIATAVKASSVDNFYLPPVEVHISNKRWEKCIDWWNNLPEDELAYNIRRLNEMNTRNAYILLRAFEHLELFEKCSIIKRAIS